MTNMNKLLIGLALLPTSVFADPPSTVLVAARIHLTTTSFETDFKPYADSFMGLARERSEKGTVRFPSRILDGYIARSTTQGPLDASKKLAIDQLARNGHIFFWPATDIVRIKHPEELLVSTGTPGSYKIDVALIESIERGSGPFDGNTAYGQPFYLPADQARRLAAGPPRHMCYAKYADIPRIVWISYSDKIENEKLNEVCERNYQNQPTEEDVAPLLATPGVFVMGIPSD